MTNYMCFVVKKPGEVKSEDAAKEGDEKPEEDNDYHRSDEQVRTCTPLLLILFTSELYCKQASGPFFGFA